VVIGVLAEITDQKRVYDTHEQNETIWKSSLFSNLFTYYQQFKKYGVYKIIQKKRKKKEWLVLTLALFGYATIHRERSI